MSKYEEEEDESMWLEPKKNSGGLDHIIKTLSAATGIEEKEIEKRMTRPIKSAESEEIEEEEEEEEEELEDMDSPEVKEEMSALERELEEKRKRLEERTRVKELDELEREEEERKRRASEKEPAKKPSPYTHKGTPIASPIPPVPTPTPPPPPPKIELGSCCKRMERELLEKTNITWWQDHKGGKIISFSHTLLKLLHCPWCGAKIE